MREIKFRAKTIDGTWFYWKLTDPIDMAEMKDVIDWSTFGQYTGLKDKNDKEIYDGDWLDWNEKADGLVEWKYGAWHVCLVKTKEYFFLYPANIAGLEDGGHYSYIEIIGNIYENPELIQT